MKTLPIIFASITAAMPVVTQKTGLSQKYGFPLKMLCVLLYLLTGVISAFSFNSLTSFTVMILAALGFGAFGDFFLEFSGKRYFSLGVVFFALGHIVYSCTFMFVGSTRALPYGAAVVALTAALSLAIIIFAKSKLKLTGKKRLLLAYAPILIFAFASAASKAVAAFRADNLHLGLCIISGGALFLVSDIMIGIDKGGIKRPDFLHNAVSYTYFAAQALFALSIYFQ